MKKVLFILAAVALLSGSSCSTQYIVKPEVVHVDRPVLSCPPLKELNFSKIDLQTLTLDGKSSAGEVARAYNIDMRELTQRVSEYNRLVDEMKAAEAQMKEAQAKIDAIFSSNNAKVMEEVLKKQQQLNK